MVKKYKALYNVVQMLPVVFDPKQDDATIATVGYGVIDGVWGVYYPGQGDEAWDSLIERLEHQAHNLNAVLVHKDENGNVYIEHIFLTEVKVWALAWAAAQGQDTIWDVSKSRHIPVTEQLVDGFWMKEVK